MSRETRSSQGYADVLWSSAHAHLQGLDDSLVTVKPMLDLVPDWPAYLAGTSHNDTTESIRQQGTVSAIDRGRLMGVPVIPAADTAKKAFGEMNAAGLVDGDSVHPHTGEVFNPF